MDVYCGEFEASLLGIVQDGTGANGFSLDSSGSITADPLTIATLGEAATNEHKIENFGLSLTYAENKVAYGFDLDFNAGGGASAEISFTAKLTENWSLLLDSPTSIIPDLGLQQNLIFDANATLTGSGNVTGDPYSINIFTGVNTEDIGFGDSVFNGPTSLDVDTAVGVSMGVAGATSGQWSWEIRTSILLDGNGGFTTRSFDSFTLESVTFEDGSTPEDHGLTFVRSSGRASPNIAVPEPHSIAIWSLLGLGMVGLSYYRVRRKK